MIEIDEVISREVGIHVGGISDPDIKEVVSREVSLFIENGAADHEVISREVSIVVDASGNPPQVTGYTVTPSPTGNSVVLNWSNYNQWAVKDVSYYRIYLASAPFADVTTMTPTLTVPGETMTATLAGLPEYQDHYIAIVAVDGLGNANPAVIYAAAYILTKEVISREVGLFIGAEPVPPYQEVVSREVSMVVDNPGPPAAITSFAVTTSPTGETVTLNWSSYNQWAQKDVAFYRVYYSDTFFSSLGGVSYVDVPGETFTKTFTGLTPWLDHYYAVVPFDASGASDPTFYYRAAYVLMPEVISRELAVFIGEDTQGTIPVNGSNFSFESPVTSNFVYYGAMDAGQRAAFVWTAAGNGANGPAIFKNGSAWNYLSVQDGAQGVSLQGASAISQTVTFPSAGAYILSWKAASRSGQVNPYVVKLNGAVVSPTYSTGDTNWQPVSLTVNIAAAGTQTLTFAALNTAGGDNSVGIDAVSLILPATGLPIGAPAYHELVSREVSIVRPDTNVPAPVTGVGSGFAATTARTTYRAISLDWSSYNEWAQLDVRRYRIYVKGAFFSTVSESDFHSFAANGTQRATIVVPLAEAIYYVAVVAEDVLGNFNPSVYSISVKSSVSLLGDVANLSAIPTPTSLTYGWDLGGVGDELGDFVKEFRVYFNGSLTPVIVGPALRTWTKTDLMPETTYSVRIMTVDLNDVESAGAELNATTSFFASITAWRQYYFGTPADSGNAANLADTDGDGFVNLLEYSLGLNPLAPDSADAAQVVTEVGYLTITLTKRPGITYAIETSATPASASFGTTDTTILTNDSSTLKVRDNFLIGTQSKRFMRVRVTAPQ